MPSLPDAIVPLLSPFASLFDARTWRKAQILLTGVILAPGRRTVSTALYALGLQEKGDFALYHHVLNRASWSSLAVGRVLLGLLVRHLVPTGPLLFAIDETLERRWGAKIEALGVYRDPVRSSHGHFVKAKGLRWVSLMLLAEVPWARRVWALPFLTVLAPSARYHEARGRRHKTITDWARQMLCRLRRWLPDRDLVVVGDRTYATLKLLAACQGMDPPVTFLSRLRLDAVLHDPPPPRKPGQIGRPRIVGARLPSLKAVLADPATVWTDLCQRWPDGTERRLRAATGTALWYHPGEPVVPLRWLLLRDPSGQRDPQALLSTNPNLAPRTLLAWYLQRWQAEVTFQEVRAHLGVETQRQWSAPAIARTTPALLGLFSWLILVAHCLRRARPLRPRRAAWYPKTVPTFSDVLADIRRLLWTRALPFSMSPADPDIPKPPGRRPIRSWPPSATRPDTPPNPHCPHRLCTKSSYENVSSVLYRDNRLLHQLEAREHTAQVDADIREKREARFRKGLEPTGLPILFCSPTMELGVDISTLNTVYMRNVPPTPANFAQRSGRAGRSGQPALVITYCAAKSPHDQYFFSDPTRMVAGAVNPPTIDLANEDLIRSHLQAVWLTETGTMLGPSVRDVLDREHSDDLPLRSDIAEQIGNDRAVRATERRARRILGTLEQDLSTQAAPWFTDTWLGSATNSAERRFDESFDRWRSLYRATASQMRLANIVLNNAAATEQERREAKTRHDEAFTQQSLLLDSRATMNSDFYTYRYLAAEGFLPGYNFPRLPLMAFVPGRRERFARHSFLSRPRFLGLTEFGPQSIIYHEGSTYRVRRAILTVRDEVSVTTSAKLPVQAARICPVCGYGHFRDQKESERCVSCHELLEGGRTITNLYRIEQVSTRRATRITSDEEERQRQGYEMVTTLRFSDENGRPRADGVALEEQGETLVELRYGPATTLWRINLGWRRREQKSIYGFSVDANTGEWTTDSQAPTDAEDDGVQEGKSIERITPFVEDTRNVLVLQPKVELSAQAMISLQYALKRGIEQEFQLEESELAAEPLPDRDNRTTILFYEAAEGGAGVLTRLASDPDAIRRVASKALEVCHYATQSGEWAGFEALENQDVQCEAGCYRCLLSYYNQPDHPQIDRQNPTMLDLLCRLTRAERKSLEHATGNNDSFDEMMNACTSSLEKAWLRYLKARGYHLPDRSQPYLEEFKTRPDFAYSNHQTLVYIDGPHHETQDQKSRDAELDQRLADAGFTVVRFGANEESWERIVTRYSWVFGSGTQSKAG